MNYILVENGNIVGRPKPIPVNWKNISNFHTLDNQTLKNYGWYPYRFVEAQKTDNQYYDGSDFIIEETEVVEYQKVRNKTDQEINNEIESKWISIRNKRNYLLSQTDWTQLPDSPLSVEKQSEWQSYRQQLRDVTIQVDPFNIQWPTEPEA